jgi:uncharacterized protein YbaA (DUF1428 family)
VARYVDGYVIPIKKSKVEAYRRLAKKASKVWLEHGALEFRESVGDDLNVKMGKSFTRLARTKPGETVIFSWVVYKSRAHRDRVNAKVLKDPRIANFDPALMPFDSKRMTFGGFTVIVDA